MKAKIIKKRLIFTEYTDTELSYVREELLTWYPDSRYSDETDEPETLLFHDTDYDIHWTFFGLLDILNKNCPFDIELENEVERDMPSITADINMFEGFEFMKFQIRTVEKCLRLFNGLIEIPTGGGKTEIILGVVRYLLDNHLIMRGTIVVPSVGIAEQFHERGIKRGFNTEELGMLHGDAKDYHSKIVIGVVNSIRVGLQDKNPDTVNLVKNSDLLIYDECHHLQASSYLNIAMFADNSKYLFGFSGSPFSGDNVLEDSGDALIQGVTGGLIFKITQKYLRDIGLIATPVLFFDDTAHSGMMGKYPGNYNKIYKANIVNNVKRNNVIVDYVNTFLKYKFPVLVLIQHRDHAMNLLKQLKGKKVIVVFGGKQAFTMEANGIIDEFTIDYNIFRENFSKGVYDVIIASSVFDEGIDIPSIGAVILAGAGKSKKKLLQRIGRGLRSKTDGVNRVYIVDFMDRTHVYLNAQYRKRRELCEEVEMVIIDDKYQFVGMIHNHSEVIGNVTKHIST